MDHLCISRTEPSSVNLIQTKHFRLLRASRCHLQQNEGRWHLDVLTSWFKKLKIDAPNVEKLAEANRDGVLNPQNYNFNQTI